MISVCLATSIWTETTHWAVKVGPRPLPYLSLLEYESQIHENVNLPYGDWVSTDLPSDLP